MNALTKLNSLFVILIVAFACAGSAIAQDPPPPRLPKAQPLDWREVNSTEGGFSIKFPGAPKIEAPDLNRGPVVIKRHLYSLRLEGLSFQISFIDLPAGSDPDGALEGGIRSLINYGNARGATVVSAEPVTKGNCTGREVILSTVQAGGKADGLVDARIFFSGLRFYNLTFEAFSDTKTNREVGTTFLDSFSVTGGCSALIAPSDAPETKNEETLEGTVDQATSWRIIERNELGIRVLMPGAVRHIYGKSQSEPFPITHHTFLYSIEGSVYSAEVFGDYPPGWHTTEASYQTSLDVALYSLKKNFGAVGFEITPGRDLRLATNPGREFSLINQTRGLHGRAQIYVTPTRIYMLVAFTRSDSSLTQVSQFFSSVRISPK